jgi:hypothetical protein
LYPALLVDVRPDVYSDNVSGAENQQERLIESRGWVIGFVDGEGCFSIGFVRQPSRTGRVGYRTGFQVVQTMNRRKPRHELIRILRGHTPDIRDSG